MTARADAPGAPVHPPSRLAAAALAFALAALLCSWNPLSAPFGLVVGLVAAMVALRASVRGCRRRVWASALVVSLVAAIVSATVLARSAGVGRPAGAGPIVPTPSAEEVRRQLDDAAARTRPARERARQELEKLGPDERGKAGER